MALALGLLFFVAGLSLQAFESFNDDEDLL